MQLRKELCSAWLFWKLSEIIVSDNELLKFYGIKNNSSWNDGDSNFKKERVINKLRQLACQQQQLLRYSGISPKDISFNSINHMDILNDNCMILIYANSRILYNEREFLNKKLEVIDLSTSIEYLNVLQKRTKVVASMSKFKSTISDFLPSMGTREFWQSASIKVDDISYFPTFIGSNILLANEISNPERVIISL